MGERIIDRAARALFEMEEGAQWEHLPETSSDELSRENYRERVAVVIGALRDPPQWLRGEAQHTFMTPGGNTIVAMWNGMIDVILQQKPDEA